MTTVEHNRKVSIPTRFKTILLERKPLKGFGTAGRRFGEDSDVAPGPGSYSLYSESCWSENRESHSRRGWGSMASKSARKTGNIRYVNTGPGPGNYSYVSDRSFDSMKAQNESQISTQASLMSKIRERVKERQNSMYRQKPPARADSSRVGPGTYSVEKNVGYKPVNTSEVAFKSKVPKNDDKDFIKHASEVPPVGAYDPSPSNSRSNSQNKPSSSFFPSVVRDNIMYSDYEKVKQQIIYENKDKPKVRIMGQLREVIPGPNHYHVHESYMKLNNSKPINRKGGQIAAQAEVRFLYKDPKAAFPGPGQYKMKSDFEVERYGIYNSVFMSQTGRVELGKVNETGIHAPFDPHLVSNKEEYHCNDKNIWLV